MKCMHWSRDGHNLQLQDALGERRRPQELPGVDHEPTQKMGRRKCDALIFELKCHAT